MSTPGPSDLPGPIQVSISFDPPEPAGPVAGSVALPGSAPVRFDGWLELLAILEAAVAGAPSGQRLAG